VRRRPTRIAIRLTGAAALVALTATVAVEARPAAVDGPVCIPGGTTVPVTADAKVSAAHPRRHYGRSETWAANYGAPSVRTFVTFDLPELPLECMVHKAMFDIKGRYSGEPNPPNSWPGANVGMTLIRRPWNESRITWNNMPATHSCGGGVLDYATDSWDITGIVQKAYECVDKGRIDGWYGLRIKGWSPRNRGAKWRLIVDSREGAHPPVIELEWE
jgi:hypothetical protein